jgi:hypothetical protein
VNDPTDGVDLRLAELGKATESIAARSGFVDRLMLRVTAETVSWREEMVRSSRRLVPLAALAAMVALTWAVVSESSADHALAVADDEVGVEMEW